MHIPDGYLSPSTCAVLYATSAPFWYIASQKVKRLISGRMVPLLSIFAAFSFLIMMFNIPLPGGTTGHAVGATLVTIVLGPWAAMLAISVALAIQAIFFGDGGILSLGANSFNMAIVMPLVASGIYRLVGGGAKAGDRRKVVAAAVAGYIALNTAALLTAVEFGIQPMLFHTADGTPLYAPYPLGIAVPAMMLGHLLVAGPAEALITAFAVAYLLRTNPALMKSRTHSTMPAQRPHFAGLLAPILALIVLTPLGLLAAGTAWGEWSPAEVESWPLPFIPEGLQRFSGLWSAPLPDYATPFLGSGTSAQVIGYVFSGAIGVAILVLIGVILGRLLTRGRPESDRMSSGKTDA